MSKFLRPTEERDIPFVATRLRGADVAECYAAAGMPGELALTLSVRVSEEAFTLVSPDGTPVGICGIAAGHTPADKQVWMLATDDLLKHRRLFLRESRQWIDSYTKRVILWNWVDARNVDHIHWLQRLGAEFSSTRISNYTRTPLILFSIKE